MWVAEHHYEVLGTRFSVRSDDEGAAIELDRLLAPFRSDDLRPVRAKNLFVLASRRPGDDRRHAFRDCRRIARAEEWDTVFDPLLGELNRRAVEEMEYFGVHAGVVSSGNRTIAFPAGSGAGKSTLVAACLQAGLGYVSDEALCVDYTTSSVIAYPKPLSLSTWSIAALNVALREADKDSKRPISAESLGGEIVSNPPPLSDLVLFERSPGPSRLKSLPPSRVVASLLAYSFNHYKRPSESFTLATDLARDGCRGWQLTYQEPIAAAEALAFD